MATLELSGSRNAKRSTTPESAPVYYEPQGGIPFKEIGLTYDLHGHDHRVTVYLPEEEHDPNLTGSVAGYMATDEAYRENAMAEAAEGYPSFTIEPANEQSRWSFLLHPEHIGDPALFQSMAVHRALAVALDHTGKSKANLVGHSYGGPITAHAVAHPETAQDIEFALFEGAAAVDIDNVALNHVAGVPKMLFKEVMPLLKKYSRKESREARPEFMESEMAHIKHIGRRVRELIYLLNTPDLAPDVKKAEENGIITGGLFHDKDIFFPGKRIQKALAKRSVFDVVEFSEGTIHVDSQLRPHENALLRINVLEKMKNFKLAQKVAEADKVEQARAAMTLVAN